MSRKIPEMKISYFYFPLIFSAIFIFTHTLVAQQGNEQRARSIESELDAEKAREGANRDWELFMDLSKRVRFGALNRPRPANKSEEQIIAEQKYNQFIAENFLVPLVARLQKRDDSDIYRAGLAIYYFGERALGITTDSAQTLGKQIMEVAVKNENPGALYHYGSIIMWKENKELGVSYLKRAAELGHPNVDKVLGRIFPDDNLPVYEDILDKVFRAEIDRDELFQFAPDDHKDFHMGWILKKLDEKYHAAYQYLLGFEYAKFYLDKNRTTIYKSKALADGNVNAQRKQISSHFYKAIKDFKKILKKKDLRYKLGVNKLLGDIYSSRWFLGYDLNAAYQYYLTAAEAGNGVAQYNIGKLLYDEMLVPEHDRQAFNWLTKAYQNGQKDAIVVLAEMHEFGRGAEKDIALATAYYKEAFKIDEILAYRGLSRLDPNYIKDFPPKINLLWNTAPLMKAIEDSPARLKIIHICWRNQYDTLSYPHAYQLANLIRDYTNDQIQFFPTGISNLNELEALGFYGEAFKLGYPSGNQETMLTGVDRLIKQIDKRLSSNQMPITIIYQEEKEGKVIFNRNHEFREIKDKIEELLGN